MCIYIYTKSTILLYVIASRNQKKKVLQVSTLFLVANIGADSLLLPPNHLFTNHKRVDIYCIASNRRVEIYESADSKKGREI